MDTDTTTLTTRETALTARETALSTHGLDTLAETMRGDARLAPSLGLAYPDPADLDAWRTIRERGALSTAPVADARLTEVDVAGVPCRLVTPDGTPTGTYVHLHGGGWSFGSHLSQDERLLELAEATGLRVVSVGYRLAPEHPATDAIDDCARVTATVAADEDGFLAVGGESAGAHLAVTTLLRGRDAGVRPLDAAVLTYGVFDLAGTPSRRREPGFDTLNAAAFPGRSEAELRDPALSPLYADLADLPPARFLCGTRDGLLDDTLMLEARWRAVAPTELDLVAGARHAFTLADTTTTRRARDREHAFLRRQLAARGLGRDRVE